MSNVPSMASQIAGVLMCVEAIADAIIARDPAMGVAIEERLEEALQRIKNSDGLEPRTAVPPENLLYVLQMKRMGSSPMGDAPPG